MIGESDGGSRLQSFLKHCSPLKKLFWCTSGVQDVFYRGIASKELKLSSVIWKENNLLLLLAFILSLKTQLTEPDVTCKQLPLFLLGSTTSHVFRNLLTFWVFRQENTRFWWPCCVRNLLSEQQTCLQTHPSWLLMRLTSLECSSHYNWGEWLEFNWKWLILPITYLIK